jgi:uncharacterized membrane protein
MSDERATPPGGRPSMAMADAIALLLVGGVTLAALVIAAGLALAGLTGMLAAPGLDFVGLPHQIGQVVAGAVRLEPYAVIDLGVLILIATPVLRVAASVILFLVERDYLYTLITVTVLGLLLSSLFLVG